MRVTSITPLLAAAQVSALLALLLGVAPAAAQQEPTPVLTIVADQAKVHEGDTATFTITATPAPASAVTVGYNLKSTYKAAAVTYSSADLAGPFHVTIKAGHSAAKISVRTRGMVIKHPRDLFETSTPDEGDDGAVYCTKRDVAGLSSQSRDQNHEKSLCKYRSTEDRVGDVQILLAASTDDTYLLRNPGVPAITAVGHSPGVPGAPLQPTVSPPPPTSKLAISGLADAAVPENAVWNSPAPTATGATGSVTWTRSGTDAVLFDIDPGTGVLTLPAQDFETRADANTDGVYEVTVTATDQAR